MPHGDSERLSGASALSLLPPLRSIKRGGPPSRGSSPGIMIKSNLDLLLSSKYLPPVVSGNKPQRVGNIG
jgi:hypothetical protein